MDSPGREAGPAEIEAYKGSSQRTNSIIVLTQLGRRSEQNAADWHAEFRCQLDPMRSGLGVSIGVIHCD